MTDAENKSRLDGFLPFLLSLIAFFLLLCFPKTIGVGVRAGLELCYRAIIPSIFPYMVLSELLRGIDLSPIDRTLGRIIAAPLRVSAIGGRIILLGLLCGFPIGAKMTSELYADGQLKKEEAERLLLLSSSPSPAFVISGIGLSMLGDAGHGWKLYFILLISVFVISILIRPTVRRTSYTFCSPQKSTCTSLSGAIKAAGYGTISVTAFITFFTVLSSLVSSLIPIPEVAALIASVLEIGSGAFAASGLVASSPRLAASLLGFAVSFSGISVYLQSLSYINETDLSPRFYLIGKVGSGILSAVLAFFLFG